MIYGQKCHTLVGDKVYMLDMAIYQHPNGTYTLARMFNEFDKMSHTLDVFTVQIQGTQLFIKRREDSVAISTVQNTSKSTMQKHTQVFLIPSQQLQMVVKGRDSQGVLYYYVRSKDSIKPQSKYVFPFVDTQYKSMGCIGDHFFISHEGKLQLISLADLNEAVNPKTLSPVKMSTSINAPGVDVYFVKDDLLYLGCGSQLLCTKVADVLEGKVLNLEEAAQVVSYKRKILHLSWFEDSLIVI